ncbi:flagellin [Polynucleobacter sp. SHI8]|uniref:flagellin N-terminal helical domain-containing protein n=1 Tax=unclassified Polynucleobacter TaxID=2640945 RepID=UPI002491599F|nr:MULTISPECIES: flagellin [unclassified Polynucleobacter]BDW11743.1 flagellin [Polynucleobacter sp. SHI2]BDW14190.1 flagellin [Polynucleobacter sp. SHI8]
MPSIINTNITSLIAQNNLTKTGDALQTTIQRLSSGLRVNNAADDASGFAIANRMDAQIRGMAVATRNANDAISFSQTASGALSQISNNLQRMRELAVQAANGSNSASDTSLLNQEFSQLQTEVSRIQGSTTFNNVSVFTASDTVFQIGANTTANDRVNMQGTALTTTMSLGTQTITDRAATTAQNDISTALAAASAYATAGNGFSTDSARINYISNAAIGAILGSQKLSFAAENDAINTLNAITSAYNSSGVTTVSATSANYFTDISKVVGATAAAGPITLSVLLPSAWGGATGATYQADSLGTNPVTYTNASQSLKINVNAISVGATGTAGTLLATQTATSGQSLALSAISAIDNALTEVNTASATQGALQNRFSAVISNLTAFSQSQTAAKSRIVDADFAAETAKLSKNQILQQAGTAMLAQANQLPSSVLSLLK